MKELLSLLALSGFIGNIHAQFGWAFLMAGSLTMLFIGYFK
jgi:hypothetical protein